MAKGPIIDWKEMPQPALIASYLAAGEEIDARQKELTEALEKRKADIKIIRSEAAE